MMKNIFPLLSLLLLGCQNVHDVQRHEPYVGTTLEERLEGIDDADLREKIMKINDKNAKIDKQNLTPAESLRAKERLYESVGGCDSDTEMACEEFFYDIIGKATADMIALEQDGFRYPPTSAFFCKNPEKNGRCSSLDDNGVQYEGIYGWSPDQILRPDRPALLQVDPSYHLANPVTFFMTSHDDAGVLHLTPVPRDANNALDLSAVSEQTFPMIYALIKGEDDVFYKKVEWIVGEK